MRGKDVETEGKSWHFQRGMDFKHLLKVRILGERKNLVAIILDSIGQHVKTEEGHVGSYVTTVKLSTWLSIWFTLERIATNKDGCDSHLE